MATRSHQEGPSVFLFSSKQGSSYFVILFVENASPVSICLSVPSAYNRYCLPPPQRYMHTQAYLCGVAIVCTLTCARRERAKLVNYSTPQNHGPCVKERITCMKLIYGHAKKEGWALLYFFNQLDQEKRRTQVFNTFSS